MIIVIDIFIISFKYIVKNINYCDTLIKEAGWYFMVNGYLCFTF